MPEAGKRMAVHASWWNCANKGTTAVAIASPGSCTSRVSAAVRKAAIASAPRIAIMMHRSHRATAPNQIWVGDITCIETQEGWLYLAGILDLYSRKLVGWAMSEHIDTTLVLKALAMACWHRRPPANLLFHSDRGVQYASGAYRQALRAAGLVASMSRKGNCYDNATMESFWSTLKLDLVYRRNFVSHQQARTEIFDYIEVFYNRQRTHSALGYFSPVDFELINN